MRKLLFILIIELLGLNYCIAQENELKVIYSKIAKPSDDEYVSKLIDQINGEFWGYHSGLIGTASASSTLKENENLNYSVNNLSDLNLTTAWVEGEEGNGIGESFSFQFNWKNSYEGYGKVYCFSGIIEVFNGYCKSEKLWLENGRIKQLKMYLNNYPVCLIELSDSWQYQKVNIQEFFKSEYNLNGKFTLKDNDVLKFEIIELYPGTKYNDVCLSEFVFESPAN
ncbi:hypothetical protein EI427_24560 [Flammeovirga pectinis]|uniref:NAD glycohydrolase translocation F5/8 type C domain-containing protein n=1 Tax=Flammeovirga pectinis TaxID=2494373 RepID=A0A3S9PB13_9BACT|nr:hypothetical protein [Flammeovirga pectinis]AZQ65388.1 hypothetical protein EI427_24560 [Flammeovirga pectinis]